VRALIASEIHAQKADERQAEHLSTSHLREEIKARTVSGGLASSIAQGSQLLLTLAYNVTLARLLSPREFGLVAMAMTWVGFMGIFRDAGLSTATIQREDITHAQVSNLFWINVTIGVCAALAMAILSPAIAWFYRQPEVGRLALVFAGTFLFEGLSVQHLALLNRRMRFKVVSAIEVGATAAGLATGVLMAVWHWGPWSLVAAVLATSATKTLAVWIASPWRPKRPTRKSGTRPLLHFGADLTMVGILYAVARGSDGLLIGRFMGTEAAGLYSRATALLARPLERLIIPIYQVIVPALSRLQNDPERYRRVFLDVFEGLAMAGFVFTGVFLPLAHPAVIVVLGRNWEGAAPIFAALTIAAVFAPLSAAASWVYTSQGRGRALLLTAVITAVTMTSAFVIGLPWGPTGVALAYAGWGIFVDLPVTFHIAGRRGPVTTRDLGFTCVRHLPVCLVVMAVTFLLASSRLASSPVLLLFVGAPLGALAGAATAFLTPSGRRLAFRFIGSVKDIRGLAAGGRPTSSEPHSRVNSFLPGEIGFEVTGHRRSSPAPPSPVAMGEESVSPTVAGSPDERAMKRRW
jgi:O-antigen/teichoic acid export membrane protein